MPEICSRFVDCHVFRRRGGVSIGTTGMRKLQDEWLVLKRARHVLLPGTWQMVSGNIEPGEKAYTAAARELKEETGLVPLHFYQASYVNRFYLAATDQIVFSPVFAAQVASEADVVLSDEHVEHAWVSFEEARNRYPWPGQKESITTIRDQFILHDPRPESMLDHLVPVLQKHPTHATSAEPAAHKANR